MICAKTFGQIPISIEEMDSFGVNYIDLDITRNKINQFVKG